MVDPGARSLLLAARKEVGVVVGRETGGELAFECCGEASQAHPLQLL